MAPSPTSEAGDIPKLYWGNWTTSGASDQGVRVSTDAPWQGGSNDIIDRGLRPQRPEIYLVYRLRPRIRVWGVGCLRMRLGKEVPMTPSTEASDLGGRKYTYLVQIEASDQGVSGGVSKVGTNDTIGSSLLSQRPEISAFEYQRLNSIKWAVWEWRIQDGC